MSRRKRKSVGVKAERVVAALRKVSVLRARDLVSLGISRQHLAQLTKRGVLERVGWGLYTLPDADRSIHHSLVEACQRVPHGVVCLLSALRFHGLTTQAPFEVWMAIPSIAAHPGEGSVPLRVVHFPPAAMVEGVEEHVVEGARVRVFSPAKTVADCFKYRNKIGLDVALEALREGMRERRFAMDELWHFAKICRVSVVIRPYLEGMT